MQRDPFLNQARPPCCCCCCCYCATAACALMPLAGIYTACCCNDNISTTTTITTTTTTTAKVGYNEILANVDYLHGVAESFLTLTNLFIVAAFRKAVVSQQPNPAATSGEHRMPNYNIQYHIISHLNN